MADEEEKKNTIALFKIFKEGHLEGFLLFPFYELIQ